MKPCTVGYYGCYKTSTMNAWRLPAHVVIATMPGMYNHGVVWSSLSAEDENVNTYTSIGDVITDSTGEPKTLDSEKKQWRSPILKRYKPIADGYYSRFKDYLDYDIFAIRTRLLPYLPQARVTRDPDELKIVRPFGFADHTPSPGKHLVLEHTVIPNTDYTKSEVIFWVSDGRTPYQLDRDDYEALTARFNTILKDLKYVRLLGKDDRYPWEWVVDVLKESRLLEPYFPKWERDEILLDLYPWVKTFSTVYRSLSEKVEDLLRWRWTASLRKSLVRIFPGRIMKVSLPLTEEEITRRLEGIDAEILEKREDLLTTEYIIGVGSGELLSDRLIRKRLSG